MLIKYAVLQLIVAVYLIGTKFMCADIFTKATDELTFKTMRALIRNSKEPAETFMLFARPVGSTMQCGPSLLLDGWSTDKD